MSDYKNVVPITEIKVTVRHQIIKSNLVLDAPLFSEVNAYYSNKNPNSVAVKKHLTLTCLLERLNNIKANTKKENSIAILKGIYNNGTSGSFCDKGAPFLFFDIDVSNKENPHLLDAKSNADVFEELQKIAVLLWRSNSGRGMAGIFYVPKLEAILNNEKSKHLKIGNAITSYLKDTLKVNANFDSAQNKFRQIRFLAKQEEHRFLNLNPIEFHYELKETEISSNTGLARYRFDDNRAVKGSIIDQFNKKVSIHEALLDNNFIQINDTRYKHPSTTSQTTGVTQDNVFFNHSTSFSDDKVFSPFTLYLTQKYQNNYKVFLAHLETQGYKELSPQKEEIIKSESLLKDKTKNRSRQIFAACYDLLNLSYTEKITFINKNATNDLEKNEFFEHLKIKPLIIEYHKTLPIQDYVSEQLKNILDYADQQKNIILTAETGTGKTTAFLKDFLKYRSNKRLLILVPLTIIADQNNSEYDNVVCLTSKSQPNEHTKAKTAPIAVATYEQGFKHLSTSNTFDYVVIDEIHNLITANSYKGEPIKNLASILDQYNVIGLTGSPNLLFSLIGYKLLKINKNDLEPTHVNMIIDNRKTEKIILQHLNKVKGKCIIRLNSKESLKAILNEVIRTKQYKKNEVLILNSSKDIKESKDFAQLAENGCFSDNIKLVLTTGVIDEGVSIRQQGFTDVIFIENRYNPNPESLKQFLARFRNIDENRKNYYYFRETNEQFLNSWNPYLEYEKSKKDLIHDSTDRNTNESVNRDIANNDYLFFSNGEINPYALAYDVSVNFCKNLTTEEYINFLELNYNLKISQIKNYNKEQIDLTHTQNFKKNKQKIITDFWLNHKDEVFDVLFRLTSDKIIRANIQFTGLNPADNFFSFINDNLKIFETLFLKSIKLENLGVIDVDNELIDQQNSKLISIITVNNKIMFLETIKTIENPLTKTDEKNRDKIFAFIKDVGNLKKFTNSDLLKLWEKQRSRSIKFSTVVLRELVLKYLSFEENKKDKFWTRV